jgi:hypothetical protein
MDKMKKVTKKEMMAALINSLGKKGMSLNDLEKLCEYLTSFFDYTDEVIDVRLTEEDRDVFSMLEEEGLLCTEEEDLELKGKLWHIKYWKLNEEEILRLAGDKKSSRTERDDIAYS